MEARIFMKFETYAHKTIDHQPKFHKDQCKDARKQVVNARAHNSAQVGECFGDAE